MFSSCAEGPPLSLRKAVRGTTVLFLPLLSWGQVPCSWVGSRWQSLLSLGIPDLVSIWAAPLFLSRAELGLWLGWGLQGSPDAVGRATVIIRSHSASLYAPAIGTVRVGLRGAWLSFRMRRHFSTESFSAQPQLASQCHAEIFAFKNLSGVSLDALQQESSVNVGIVIGVTLPFSAK